MKIFLKIFKVLYLFFPLTFLYCNTATAGFGERSWLFNKNERINYYVPNHPSNPTGSTGIIFGCEQFQPTTVSFLIFYAGEAPILRANPDAIINKKILRPASPTNTERGYMVLRNIQQLDITLLYESRYNISNITGSEILGINCDTGDVVYPKN